MKSLLTALVLVLVPVTAHADLAPEPEKDDGCAVAGDGPDTVAMLGALAAVGVIAVAARRRARS